MLELDRKKGKDKPKPTVVNHDGNVVREIGAEIRPSAAISDRTTELRVEFSVKEWMKKMGV